MNPAWSSPVVDMLLRALSRPRRTISEAPQEADICPRSEPAGQRGRLVLQHRGPVQQPVEPHRPLDDQWEHSGGEGGLASPPQDHEHIITTYKREKEGQKAFKHLNADLY